MNEYVYSIGGMRQGKAYLPEQTLLQLYIAHHKSHMEWPRIEPGPPR